MQCRAQMNYLLFEFSDCGHTFTSLGIDKLAGLIFDRSLMYRDFNNGQVTSYLIRLVAY